ncbi:MAG: hypothetical protein EZS28_045141 [Streblomastix strix]|uniref:Uncharacterized protein n=1 Tax=Streblomastix strix TaxID=222440 RepID=A0A5J4TNE3_9EUKA|nr:MAG: hypothetical protein EZS28_045141 [Streblomastix strix]
MENVDSPSTLLQGSLAGTGGTLGNGLDQCSESSPHNEHLLCFQLIIEETRDQTLSSTGMRGMTALFARTWVLIKSRECIMTGFFLLFRDNLSETRLNTSLKPCPFKRTLKTNKAYKEILQSELEEEIIEITP